MKAIAYSAVSLGVFAIARGAQGLNIALALIGCVGILAGFGLLNQLDSAKRFEACPLATDPQKHLKHHIFLRRWRILVGSIVALSMLMLFLYRAPDGHGLDVVSQEVFFWFVPWLIAFVLSLLEASLPPDDRRSRGAFPVTLICVLVFEAFIYAEVVMR